MPTLEDLNAQSDDLVYSYCHDPSEDTAREYRKLLDRRMEIWKKEQRGKGIYGDDD